MSAVAEIAQVVEAAKVQGPTTGKPIVYALTIPANAPNPALPRSFVAFVLSSKGQAIMSSTSNGIGAIAVIERPARKACSAPVSSPITAARLPRHRAKASTPWIPAERMPAVSRSSGALPCDRMTIRKLADEVLEIVLLSRRLPEIADDAEEKRVAADTAEMFAKQVRRSLYIAGGRGAEDLDVVAFPGPLPAIVTLA